MQKCTLFSGTNSIYNYIVTLCIGSIVAQYDTDGKIPFYGIDGNDYWKIESAGVGLHNLMSYYKDTVDKCEFNNGSINYTPLIQKLVYKMKKRFNDNPSSQCYDILVIFSSGAVDDFDNMMEELQLEAQFVPFSIITLGIGQVNNFKNFKEMSYIAKKKNMRDMTTFVNTCTEVKLLTTRDSRKMRDVTGLTPWGEVVQELSKY